MNLARIGTGGPALVGEGWTHPADRDKPEYRERWQEFAVKRRYYENAPDWQRGQTPEWYLEAREAQGADMTALRQAVYDAAYAARLQADTSIKTVDLER